jgi:hypothetical protein
MTIGSIGTSRGDESASHHERDTHRTVTFRQIGIAQPRRRHPPGAAERECNCIFDRRNRRGLAYDGAGAIHRNQKAQASVGLLRMHQYRAGGPHIGCANELLQPPGLPSDRTLAGEHSVAVEPAPRSAGQVELCLFRPEPAAAGEYVKPLTARRRGRDGVAARDRRKANQPAWARRRVAGRQRAVEANVPASVRL